MTSKLTITDERVISVIERLEHYACNLKWTNVRGAQDLLTAADGLRELQERRKADSEPVAWMHSNNDIGIPAITVSQKIGHYWMAEFENVQPLYRHAQPAPERDRVRGEHAEWSQATFGDVGPVGPLKHLSKEALEAAAEPGDLSEWADMQFLLWDAQRRAGITDEQITQAMIEKLAVNKLREWPEPKDGEPRLHIKEQSAPVMPNFKKLARELVENLVDCGGLDAGVKGKYLKWTEKTCRSAMLPATPPAPKQEIFNVNHLMIDLETMGNKPTAPIVTIGAVFFDPQTGCLGAEFYMAVNLASAMEQGATPDGDTILWWLKQSEAARAAICTDDTKHIAEVLSELSSFISRNADNPSYLKVWGNGANFDNVILRSAYDRADKTCPWQFWNDSDVRTMVSLGKELGFDPKRNMPFDGVAHNALADARHQAKYVSAIWQKLFPATSAEE